VAEVPDEIKALFDLYSENGIMTADHIHRFLIEVQKQEKATLEEAQANSVGLFRHWRNFFHFLEF
jgi:phosphatidylinositol phospholipase C delta